MRANAIAPNARSQGGDYVHNESEEDDMDDPAKTIAGWQWLALGSAFFAALTALLGKVAVAEMNSNLATLIRTGVILVVAAGIVTWRGDWQPVHETSARAWTF